MDSAQLAPILEKKIAVLPGGRDRHGGSIVIFPSHGEFVEFSYSDVVSILGYLSQIPEESVRSRGYTIIVDMRHAWIRYLKTVLKAIQHVLYGKIRQTIIVKPEQFLEKQRILIDLKLEVYEFKVYVVSLHKLSRHVDIGQLPTIFNGHLAYDHRIWLDLRSRYESFLREAASLLKSMDTQGAQGATSKSSSNDSLELSSAMSSSAAAGVRGAQDFIVKGQKLLDDLRGDDVLLESGHVSSQQQQPRNPDIQIWAQRVDAVLRQVRGKEDTARITFEKDKAQREQTEKVVYEQFLMGVNNVSDWLIGPGEKWLLTLHEIGESSDEAEQLKRDHEQLKTKAREIEDQTGELRSIADELLTLNHPQSPEIQRKRDYLDKLTKGFVFRVERQNEAIRMSARFHKLIDEFTEKLDDMLESLCSEVSANDVPSAQSAIDSLDVRVSSIEKAYDEVMNEGKRFLDSLNTREQQAPHNNYEMNTRDYLPGLVHVRHMLADLQDRRQRSQELADVRRLKLQQMLQLFTCESDAIQAIKWLHDLCDTLLTQHGKLGTNADEAAVIRRDHQKLEQTARSTYEYGRQLTQISSVLRRSLRFEMAPNFDLSHRLEEAWSRFCRGLSERVSRVNLTQAFYHTIKQVNERLEHLCARVGDELEQKTPTSPRAADQRRGDFDAIERSKNAVILRRYENQRRDLVGDVGELRHMSDALVARMEHPVDTKELAHVNRTAIEDIRFHIDQRHHGRVQVKKHILPADRAKRHILHEIVVEHLPIRSPQMVKRYSRLDTTFMKECRQSTDWVFLRVDEMEPSMLDVGNNLDESLALQAQHTELMQKLQAKQSNIEELLSKADQMVSEQPEPEAAVYEAMADSLGAAWKELSRQLQLRANLLEQAVSFFTSAHKHKQQMDQVESYLQNLPKTTDSMESVKQISKKHDQMRLDLLDAAVEVMTFGQLTIEKLREIGTFVDNEKRPRQALDACARIEDVMLRINDRRKRLELTWDDKKSQLDLNQQACQLIVELQQIEDWINRNGDNLQRQTDLGDSEPTSEALLREHEQLLNDAKRMQDKANRMYPMAEQLVSMGYDDGGQLLQRCSNVKRRFDDLLHPGELRRQLLLAAVAFFRAAQSTIARLDDLESEIKSLSLSRHSDTLARRHAELAARVQETAQPALAQGRALLQRVGSNEPGAQGVARKMNELNRRVAGLDEMCTAHKAEAMARSKKYQDFLQQYTSLHTWLVNVGEAFLYSQRDMGTTLPTVNEFLDRHRQIAADIAHKEPDVLRFLQWANEIQGDMGDPDYEDMRRKADDIKTRWEKLKKAIDTRLELTNIYHQFHRQAMQHAADLDTFDAVVRTSRGDQNSQHQLDDMMGSLGRSYDQLKGQGEKFLVQSRVVINDPGLDVRTAQLCVETLLEHFGARQRGSREGWSDWQSKVVKDKAFQENWNAFKNECKRYIHYISELKGDASLAFTHFEHPPAVVAERQERALQDFVPRARQAQRELETLLRTAETLGSQGETHGEKEKIVNELVHTHKEFQQTVTTFEVLTSMTITFFKNLQQVDEWIDRVRDKFQPDRLPHHDAARMEQLVQEHQAATETVEQLIRFARTEGQKIVNRAREPDVAPEIRRECEKIPSLVEERTNKWERISTEQQQQLQQHSHVAKFEREIVEIFETIETLRRQVRDLKPRLGESPQAAQAAIREFREVERKVNQTDVRVRSLVNTAESMLSGPYRGNQALRQRTDELKERWSDFRRELDDLNQKLAAASTYWTLVEETEEWIRETTDRIVDVGRKVSDVKTSEDANQLMGHLERYMKPKQAEQETRMREMEKQAKVLYGEEAEHNLQRQKKKYKEIIDSFVLVNDQLFSLAETYRTEEIKQKEIREQQQAQRPPPVPPRFVQTLRETEVTEGSKVEFNCQVTGYPEPEVKWFKDGVPIVNNPDYETSASPHGMCHMKIEETFTEDSAVYTCRATNQAGTTDTSARLTVRESPQVRMQPPVFTKKLESTTVEETTTHTFECHVTGEPTPVVSWYKNEQCIDHSPDYQSTFNNGVCRMRIEETVMEDEARYTCRATNGAGDATTSAKLTVTPKGGLEAPIFVSPLQNVTVQQGEKIVLETVVRGAPVPEIEWRQNNVVIRDSREVRTTFDGSRASLTVSEAYPMNAGSYMVIARNRAGEASSTGFVTVRTRPPPASEGDAQGMQAPRILPPLQSHTIVENNRLMFETKITGEPTPEVVWYKDDVPIYPGSNIQILKDSYGWHRLVIERVTKQDSGVYLIRATNAAGEAKSLATLQVNPPPAPVTRTTQKVVEEFYESQTGGFAPGTSAPTFARPLQDVQAPLGTRARIDAVITGSPKPKVTWLFNGQPITQSTNSRQLIEIGDTYSIVIPQVGPEHLGTYTLIAENERGTAQSTGTLGTESDSQLRASPYVTTGKAFSVTPKPYVEPPHFTQTLTSVVSGEGEEARFEGIVTGIPPPEITWYKDGKELKDPTVRTSFANGKAILIIPRVTTEHTGKYTCSAKNDGGLATSSAQLVVTVSKEAPDFVQRLISREVMEGASLRWEVRVSGDPPPTVTWLRNNMPIRLGAEVQAADEGRGVHVLYIPRLEQSDTGQFTCKAENEAGEARSTADLIVRGKDQPPRVYYHVTRVYQQNHELGMESNRFHSGPLSEDEGATSDDKRGTMGILL